jgi:hypothetical protein
MASIVSHTNSSLAIPPASPKLLGDVYESEVTPGSGAFLVVAPRAAITFEQFQTIAPNRSVALDGLVKGKSQDDLKRCLFNFNHHEDVDRDITLCTSQQVAVALKKGLFQFLLDEGVPNYRVFVNDPDPDSALASALLLYPDEIKDAVAAHRLLSLVGELDVSAGVHGPEVHSLLMREGAWIFEPYYRAVPRLYDMNGYGVAQVLLEQHSRIRSFLLGRGDTAPVRADSETLYDGKGWMLIKELGPFARLKVFQDRTLEGLVVLKGESEHGYRYSAVRNSRYSAFPLLLLTDVLNRCETLLERGSSDSLLSSITLNNNSFWIELAETPTSVRTPWGGGNGVIGCLRQHGSLILPSLIGPLVDRFMCDLARNGQSYEAANLAELMHPRLQ